MKQLLIRQKVVGRTIFGQLKLVFWPKILFGFGIFEENVRREGFFGLKNLRVCVKC